MGYILPQMTKNCNKQDYEKLTKQTYNQEAESFAKTRQKKDFVLDYFFKWQKPKGKILDLGCGSGRALKYLNKQRFFNNPKNSYLGIDYSKNLLNIAKSYAMLNNLAIKKIGFKYFDFKKINLQQKFDYILALASLHHIEPKNHLSVFKKIHAFLKPEGEIAGFVWTPPKKLIPNWEKINDQNYLKPWNGKNGAKIFIYLFKKSELGNLLKSAGFKKIETKIVGKNIKKNIYFKATY